MNKKCAFISSDGSCRILDYDRCKGICSFYKSREQFVIDADNAIEMNRKRGLCDCCKYFPAKSRCKKSTEGG